MELQTNYAIHEQQYVWRRSKGFVGWNDQEGTDWYLQKLGQWTEGSSVTSGSNVLELGCGAGDLSLLLLESGFQASGIDISPTAIEWASLKADERGVDAQFVCGSVLELPFEDQSFDWVVDGSCWHCIIGEDRKQFLLGIARVLRPGGIFTGTPMVNGSKLEGNGYDPSARIQTIEGFAVRYWAMESEIIQDLIDFGFEVQRSKVICRDGEGDDVMLVDATRK